MPDIFDTAITKISSIYELVKKIGNADLLNEISDLKIELADIKSAYADLKNENTRLKAALSGKGSSVGMASVIRK
ncbi:MAG: hypothetical protein LBK08_01640 [Treponema sp.]|jgi:hypothetical protein|nr:hypothetical protein [Treponema sp.]